MSKHLITHCEHGIDLAYRCIDCIESECYALRARVQELERRQAMLPSDLRVIADIGFPATAERVNGELEALRHDLRKVMDSRNAEVNALEALRASMLEALELLVGDKYQAVEHNPEDGARCFYCGGPLKVLWHEDSYLEHEMDCDFVKARAVLARVKGDAE